MGKIAVVVDPLHSRPPRPCHSQLLSIFSAELPRGALWCCWLAYGRSPRCCLDLTLGFFIGLIIQIALQNRLEQNDGGFKSNKIHPRSAVYLNDPKCTLAL